MPSLTPYTALTHPSRAHRRMFTRIDADTLEMCIDNSTLEKVLTCPRSYEFYHVFGRDSGSRDALNYGTAIHLALEHYFTHGNMCVAQLLHDHFAANPCSDGSWRNLDHALEAVKRYAALREQLPPWRPLTHNDKPAVEIGFKLPLLEFAVKDHVVPYPEHIIVAGSENSGYAVCRTIRVCYTGKIDLAIQSMLSADKDSYDILDHKTTSIGGPTFWKAFRTSAQMRGYSWAATQLFGKPPTQTIIDAIVGRAPTVKAKGIPHECEQMGFQYSPEQLSEWHNSVTSHVNTTLTRLVSGFFPESNTHCSNKFGMCDYFDVCCQQMNARHILLASGQFADRTWSPIA